MCLGLDSALKMALALDLNLALKMALTMALNDSPEKTASSDQTSAIRQPRDAFLVASSHHSYLRFPNHQESEERLSASESAFRCPLNTLVPHLNKTKRRCL